LRNFLKAIAFFILYLYNIRARAHIEREREIIYIYIYTGCFILISSGKYLWKYRSYEKCFR